MVLTSTPTLLKRFLHSLAFPFTIIDQIYIFRRTLFLYRYFFLVITPHTLFRSLGLGVPLFLNQKLGQSFRLFVLYIHILPCLDFIYFFFGHYPLSHFLSIFHSLSVPLTRSLSQVFQSIFSRSHCWVVDR